MNIVAADQMFANPDQKQVGVLDCLKQLREAGAGLSYSWLPHDRDLSPDRLLAWARENATALMIADVRNTDFSRLASQIGILAMSGLLRLVVASDMESVAFSESAFKQFAAGWQALEKIYGRRFINVVPISARDCLNVDSQSPRLSWHDGPTLAECLSQPVPRPSEQRPFRLAVERVAETSPGCWTLHGVVASGTACSGMTVRILPAGLTSRIVGIAGPDGPVQQAATGASITLTLADGTSAQCGDILAAAESPPEVADQFEATLLWLSDSPLLPGRAYSASIHGQEVGVNVTAIKYRKEVETDARLAARTIDNGQVAVVNIATDQAVAFEPHAVNAALGTLTLFEPAGRKPVGIGGIDFALRRASNIHWQALEINKQSRAALKLQRPGCIWFTGLSGSGKSTIANALEKKLFGANKHTYLLDGDNVRHGLNRDLGFAEADRVENIRRVAEVAKLMVDAGLIVLVSFISPFRSERRLARSLFAPGEFIEVFVDTPLSECERRDPKGLYAKARRGELKNFTGIDSDYEPPENPEIHLRAGEMDTDQCAEQLARLFMDG